MNKKKITKVLLSGYVATLMLFQNVVVFAQSDAGQAQDKLNTGFTTIKVVITGIIVIVGIIAAAKIAITKLPSLDDPHVKNELFKGLAGVGCVVAAGGALTWIVPWIYGLFQ